MLSGLDRVTPIDDPHLGHHIGVWRPIPLAWATASELPKLRTLREFKREQRDYLLSDRYQEHWAPALRDFIRARFEPQASEDAEARGIVDPLVVVKEPAAHAADLLVELFPESTIIFLLRDGRDVVDSWLDGYADGAWATEEGAYPLAEEGRIPFIRWQATVWLHRTETMKEVFSRHDPERRVMVRYEDLRADPVAALERISRTLGTRTGRTRLEEIAAADSFERVPQAEKGNGLFVRKASPGGWRESMSTEEIEAMDEILGEKLVELRYAEPDEVTRPQVRLQRRFRRPAA